MRKTAPSTLLAEHNAEQNQNYPPPQHFPEPTSREETAEKRRGQAEEEEEEESRAGNGQACQIYAARAWKKSAALSEV